MKPSSFQFSNPVLVKMIFEINRNFKNDKNDNIDIPKNFNVSIHENENSPEAIVELTVEIGRQDESTPYYISATEGAKFRWGEEASKKKDSLLQQNAPALLLGYLRSIIATVSSASPFETINIPFMDFTKKEETNKLQNKTL